jgi:hypothetical protein
MTKEIITIDISALALIEQDGDKFLINPKAEEALLKFIELRARMEELETRIKESLGLAMEQMKTKKIEGEAVKAIKRVYGSKYEVTDPEVAKALGLVKEKITYTPDTKEIDLMAEESGELPDGIKLKDRAEQVTISEIK